MMLIAIFFAFAILSGAEGQNSTKWAVLIAGSNGYENYRHQADVCHAYQILKRGGLKDENIIVFMFDDIAYHPENPRPGVIINRPDGDDVYTGVPKDYVGEDVNAVNFFAVLLGDKTALTGGSGKVVESGPDDHIFVYYTDHGAAGVLGLPNEGIIYANDLNDVLKQKHASGSYKSLVFYLEACESGSIFEGLLPEGLSIYATTASNSLESSFGMYCPGDHPSPPQEYTTCLGDLYSVAWMEDSDQKDLGSETLQQQYELVKNRTANTAPNKASNVMQFGELSLNADTLSTYMGASLPRFGDAKKQSPPKAVKQRDADLAYFWSKLHKAPEGSAEKVDARKRLHEVLDHRAHVDSSIAEIGVVLLGTPEKSSQVLNNVRASGQPLVDDWDCLKSKVRIFESHCGKLLQYGMKHTRAMANMCNSGVKDDQMTRAATLVCSSN